MPEIEKLQETLARIAELAGAVNNGVGFEDENYGDHQPTSDMPGCSVKALPTRLLIKAAKHAMQQNPVNSPMLAPVGAGSNFQIIDPMQIAVLTAKYFGPSPRRLTVSFMESTPDNLRTRILSHMNAWTRTGCISFVETRGTGNVRISREGNGYWSYLGTDVLLIPTNRPTMNLQRFTMDTPESEYLRVVRHETGHTLGFPHEHMRRELIARIDREKAYAYFLATQGWDRAMVNAQVLTPLEQASIMSTAPDQTSIMCYQLPASITRDGRPIIGGKDINATDFSFVGRIYPKPGAASAQAASAPHDVIGDGAGDGAGYEEWPESEDVEVTV